MKIFTGYFNNLSNSHQMWHPSFDLAILETCGGTCFGATLTDKPKGYNFWKIVELGDQQFP